MEGWVPVAVTALVMAVGLTGTVLPGLPGLPVIWGAALVYGIVAGFGTPGRVAFAVMTLLALAGLAAGVVLPTRAGAASGASRDTLVAAVVFGIVGFFVIPVLGLPIGAVAGVLLAEQRRSGDFATAWRTTRAVVVGFGLGILVEMAAGAAMVLAWVAWVVAAR